jgi:hypothetical protein
MLAASGSSTRSTRWSRTSHRIRTRRTTRHGLVRHQRDPVHRLDGRTIRRTFARARRYHHAHHLCRARRKIPAVEPKRFETHLRGRCRCAISALLGAGAAEAAG